MADGARAARTRAEQRAILAGWVAGYCGRVKKFPTLQSLLKRPGTPQTLEEQHRALQRLADRQNRIISMR